MSILICRINPLGFSVIFSDMIHRKRRSKCMQKCKNVENQYWKEVQIGSTKSEILERPIFCI